MRLPWTRWGMVLGLSVLAACSREQPTAPRLHALTGRLRLIGYLVDADGRFAGTRVVEDADGVPVELVHGHDVVARTTTTDGTYRFSGLAPGDYVARSLVFDDFGAATPQMTIAHDDVAAGVTLELASRGDLLPAPNPFADSTRIFFTVSYPAPVEVAIRDVDGNLVKTLLSLDLEARRYGVYWNRRDVVGHLVSGSPFWVTYTDSAGADVRAHVLFHTVGAAP